VSTCQHAAVRLRDPGFGGVARDERVEIAMIEGGYLSIDQFTRLAHSYS
jgi:hypothetical protein